MTPSDSGSEAEAAAEKPVPQPPSPSPDGRGGRDGAADAPRAEPSRAEPSRAETARVEADDQFAFLSRLAGGLAHEIKNPLSTMAINLALLQEDWERVAAQRSADVPLPPREQRTLKRVTTLQREVQRLETIVQDFLDFVRGAAVNRRPQNIGAIVQEVLDFVEPENDQAGVRQRTDIVFGLPLVLVDEAQIKQALLNLLINARQAMPTGGEILVRVRRVGNDAEVSITDTGIGMTPTQVERCFDVYWSNKKGGTGLGLSTTRRIVEEHGGSIHVITEQGRGTSFLVCLPLAVELTGDNRSEVQVDPTEPRTFDVEARERRLDGAGEDDERA
ncbi:sensor histidine kinase [Engelhardtia mirabilis]|uniref:histidine kinase n=1 Tax=Engelhardtia mirabilis TaxID=2528011 RepID=A0A518BJP3_9BACT|nr:Sporulation kinase E [Planctomycetes bacterium Pla133]QDV01526.1 Sporulation kinase E [Planctomycetes bacterium Pla86]